MIKDFLASKICSQYKLSNNKTLPFTSKKKLVQLILPPSDLNIIY